jgi:hypothetical protein
MKAQTMSLNTGQSTSSVTRANLTELNKTIDALKQELEEAEQVARGDSGVVSLTFRRNP